MMGEGRDETLDWGDVEGPESPDEWAEGWEREGEERMARNGRSKRFVEVGDVEVLKETPRAILCRFVDEKNRERWIPISQTPPGFEWEVGKTVALEVTEWLTETEDWDTGPEEKEDPEFSAPNVVCLRETDRAIEVRVGKEVVWMPKSHVRKTSEVQHDGDRGVLVCSLWIAEQKGFVEGAGPAGPSVADDVRGQRKQTGIPFEEDFFPDDYIPF